MTTRLTSLHYSDSLDRMKILRSLALLLMLACPVLAWNGPGHKVVALIASSELDPEINARIQEILSHHPFPEARELLAASVWPDQIKEYPEYAQGPWHYANVPLFLEGPIHPTQDGGQVVEALEQNLEILKSEASSDADKAVALAWVVHILGDIHQPLHAATAYSPQFPEGDRGGNEYHIRYQEEETNLHSFWDSTGGRFWKGENGQALSQVAEELRERFPSDAMVELTDPRIWRHESHILARYLAYPGAVQNQPVTPDYVATARAVSERRLALAGYRLAAVLRTVLQPK